jgi:hypothetical protein
MQYTNYGDEYELFPKGGGCSSIRSIGLRRGSTCFMDFLSESSVAGQNDTVVNETMLYTNQTEMAPETKR